jgi:hypothetical protein
MPTENKHNHIREKCPVKVGNAMAGGFNEVADVQHSGWGF